MQISKEEGFGFYFLVLRCLVKNISGYILNNECYKDKNREPNKSKLAVLQINSFAILKKQTPLLNYLKYNKRAIF